MPKIVDHDERRREIFEATWRVIARDGIEAATVREIAREVGYSNGVLSHYFTNREETLISAHKLASVASNETLCDEIQALIDGSSVEAIMHPEHIVPERQKAMADAFLERISA